MSFAHEFTAGSAQREGSRRSMWRMTYWQLGGGLLVAVVLPALVRWPDDTVGLTAASLNNAILATALAVILGYLLARKLATFPHLQAFSVILPAFSASYGLMAAGLLLSRSDYSRYQLVASFLASLAFYGWSFSSRHRRANLRLALVPFGSAVSLVEHDDVDWTLWRDPGTLPARHDGVVVDVGAEVDPEWQAFLSRCVLDGVPVYHAKPIRESLTGRVVIERFAENTLGSLVPSSLFGHVKHGFDLIFAALALPFLLPLFWLVGLAIKLDSPGPIFFTQDRVGYRGRVFRIRKLRTMYVGAPETEAHSYTVDGDPRITRLGRILRRYRIDELPQVFNILAGEMSWIGPRPEALPLSAWYDRQIPFYSYRHIVRPGVTGWAQVNQGYASGIDTVSGKLQYDFFYIKHYSPWLDLLIVMQTVRIVLSGFGAR